MNKNNATVLSNTKVRGQRTAISERGKNGGVASSSSASRSDCGFLIVNFNTPSENWLYKLYKKYGN